VSVSLTVDGLTRRFGGVTAVDDVSFGLTGGVCLVVGPNGAGKSTLLRICTGLLRPDRGRALIAGRPYAQLPDPARQVGVLLEPRFPAGRSGRNHLRVVCRAAGIDRDRVEQVLTEVGLPPGAGARPAGSYSLGMRQRLAIAVALLGDPPLLILDEPTTGLDLHGVAWLRQRCRAWSDQGRTVVVGSHSITELGPVVDDVLVLDRGKLIAHRDAAQLAVGGDLHTGLAALFTTSEG
jgi:ABC-2 type transport system ATP-binding protein